eukprot:2285747-Pyramimonas_sp.AAC.1
MKTKVGLASPGVPIPDLRLSVDVSRGTSEEKCGGALNVVVTGRRIQSLRGVPAGVDTLALRLGLGCLRLGHKLRQLGRLLL